VEYTVRHQLVGLEDVTPTAVAAANGGERQRSDVSFDGVDVLAAARDTGAQTREFWFGQLAEKDKGLYCAMDGEWKYVYSAPDDREYLLHRGAGEGPTCDRNECTDYVQDPAAQEALERLRGALVERFRRDGYADPLDEHDPHGLRRFAAPQLPWKPLDEMEDRSVVGRGWQYARWNQLPPFNVPEYDRRLDNAKSAYRFPPRQVR
jgi:arylsulfatase A-like enzyme